MLLGTKCTQIMFNSICASFELIFEPSRQSSLNVFGNSHRNKFLTHFGTKLFFRFEKAQKCSDDFLQEKRVFLGCSEVPDVDPQSMKKLYDDLLVRFLHSLIRISRKFVQWLSIVKNVFIIIIESKTFGAQFQLINWFKFWFNFYFGFTYSIVDKLSKKHSLRNRLLCTPAWPINMCLLAPAK